MADDSGGLSIPSNDNWNEWTFEQALKALTGEGTDLHTAAKATWFNVNNSPSASDQLSYHAWGDYYYGVNVNNDAVTKWTQAVDVIDEMMPDVARGKRGSMDHQSLRDLKAAIQDLAGWAQAVSAGMHSWSGRLDSHDSSFSGKAAFLIYWRLKANGDGLTDTYDQLTTRHGRPMADVIGDAVTELGYFNTMMSSYWTTAMSLNLRNWITNAIDGVIGDVYEYIVDNGLQLGTPNYKLDAFISNRDAGKSFIRQILSSYPKGDLTSAAGWQSMGDNIVRDATLQSLKDMLDTPAQFAIGALAPKYVLATSSMIELTAPPAETPPRPDPKGPDGDDQTKLPPPPGGGDQIKILPPPGGDQTKTPPPPGGDDQKKTPPPPGGDDQTKIPPPPGGDTQSGNTPPPGSDQTKIPPPPGGDTQSGTTPPPGGDDQTKIPPPPGGGDQSKVAPSPNGGGTNGNIPLPGVPVPGGSDGSPAGDRSTVGPGGDGAFDETGDVNNVVRPPGGDAGDGGATSHLPPGSGTSDTKLPPGSGTSDTKLPPGSGTSDTKLPPGSGTPADGGTGAGAGARAGADGSGGFGADPAKGPGAGGAPGGSGVGLGNDRGGGTGTGGLGGTIGDGGADGGARGGAGSPLPPPGGGAGGLGGSIGDGRGGAFGGGGAGGLGGGIGDGGGGAFGGGGAGGVGGGLGGGGLGAGAGGGGFSSGNPSQLTGGSPGMAGAPGTSDGGGGVPFFPPMMGGGQGAGGEKPQERERQTWLSEDEEIWGTRVDVGSGVVGRLDEEEFDAEELPLTGPSRRPRRADTPRRPRPDEQPAERESTTAEEEATGSA